MKRILLLFPLLITTVLIISLNIILYPKTHFDALKFNIEMNGNTQTISCWLNKEDNNYYVFLPSYTDLEYISVLTEMDVKLNDTIYKNNETLHNISPDVKYDISLLNRNGKVVENGNLIFLKTRNIPSMFIETISGDISKIHKNKNYRESGNVQIISPDGTIECHDDLKYIKGRGNFTWNSEKKPYNIEFTQPVEIFDIGTGKSWCLLANAFDASNIRNKIVFDFSKNIGLISPGSTFVDLYINNNYMGLYLLTQKAESISPSSSYLFELTPENRIDDSELIIKTDIGKNYTISSMQKNITQEKYNFLLSTINSYERALYSKSGINDEGRSFTSYIDIDSWVKKYLIELVFDCCDAGYASQFFYVIDNDDNNVFYAGPVWDYDLSMGSLSGTYETINGPEVFSSKGWYYSELFSHEEFSKAVINEYDQSFYLALKDLINIKLPQYNNLIALSANMNYIRWNCNNFDDSYLSVVIAEA